jgi:hypothetical protein
MSFKTLLLATAAAVALTSPALASDAPATGVGAASGASVIPGAPSITANPLGGVGNTLPVEDLNDPVMSPATDVPTSFDEVPMDATSIPVDEMTPPTSDSTIVPAEVPAETPAVEDQSYMSKPEPAPAAVVEAPKPKKAAPEKLSALSKKYKLMDLDTDGNKSLSKAEFTADGFANAKLFSAYDADNNGKLTYGEINAYAARIESSINK